MFISFYFNPYFKRKIQNYIFNIFLKIDFLFICLYNNIVCLVILKTFSLVIVIIKQNERQGEIVQIGDKIKRMRIEKGLTQEELANRCELSKGFISQVENDLTPSIATLIDILEILGTNLKEFLK